jgi:hypothetical protein
VYKLFDFVYSVCVCTLLRAHASTMAQGSQGKKRVQHSAATVLGMFHAAYKCHYNAMFKQQHVSWMVDEWHINWMVSTAVDAYHKALPSCNTVYLAQQPIKWSVTLEKLFFDIVIQLCKRALVLSTHHLRVWLGFLPTDNLCTASTHTSAGRIAPHWYWLREQKEPAILPPKGLAKHHPTMQRPPHVQIPASRW